jgi:two-component system phosphate regulon sensor histidine kinase PhoR
MFRRLFLPLALLLAGLHGVLGLAISSWTRLPDVWLALLLATLASAVVGVGLLGVVLGWLTHRFTQPLRHLTQAAEQIAAGATEPRVFPTERDEIGQFGEVFNRMSEALAVRIARLEDDRQQLRAILGGMVEGVVALDAGQRILFANERAGLLLDLSGVSPVGRPFWEVVRHRPLLDAVRRALESPEPYRLEINWNGNSPRTLTVHAARLPGELPRGAVLVLHDTTDLRRLERLRQEFVANVSHELKTPLSVIQICTETLIDGAVEDIEHRDGFLEQIARQCDRLHALILDLLSLARIESGEEVFHFDSVPVEPVVHDCAERHRPRAEARDQSLLVQPGPPVSVWADLDALDRILDNLLDNALKYTPPGGTIRVSWRVGEGLVHLEVADTGIGIPESDLPRIFERFYRVDKARSRELGGTGLGLSIVKHLVQALHGTVRASSTLDQGTTFTISLPPARSSPS